MPPLPPKRTLQSPSLCTPDSARLVIRGILCPCSLPHSDAQAMPRRIRRQLWSKLAGNSGQKLAKYGRWGFDYKKLFSNIEKQTPENLTSYIVRRPGSLFAHHEASKLLHFVLCLGNSVPLCTVFQKLPISRHRLSSTHKIK
jgi:hypothetical protein